MRILEEMDDFYLNDLESGLMVSIAVYRWSKVI